MKTKTILFLPSNKNHVLLFKPIYEILKEKCRVVFLTQGSYKNEGADEKLSELNIQFKTLDDYKKKDPTFILTREDIKVVVIGNDIDIIPQWFVTTATTLGIPSILIQDGMLFDYKIKKSRINKITTTLSHSKKLLNLALKLKLSKKYKAITYGEGPCTEIHVWGKYAQSYLMNKNISKNRIIITGNPKQKNHNDRTIRQQKKHLTVLYCPTSLIETGILEKKEVTKIIKTLYATIDSFENMNLIVKPHPVENKQLYYTISKNFSKIQISQNDIDELIDKSDIIITNLSTTIFDALIQNKSVIIFMPKLDGIVGKKSFPYPLIENKVVLYAENEITLKDCITKIIEKKFVLNQKILQDLIEDFYGPNDNKAAERSAKQIFTLVSPH